MPGDLKNTRGLPDRAPLIRRPVKNKVKKKYEPAQVKSGVKHVIEGRENVTRNERSGGQGAFIGPRDRAEMSYADRTKHNDDRWANARYNKESKDKYKDTMATFALEDAARARIRSVADPDAADSAERKRAARRRMRGRTGTLLSQRETLG